ncbi:hypothetical protein Ddep01_03268 [Deinococcus depolymerans]
MPFDILMAISYFDVRRIEREERAIESYLGIQRPLSTKRVQEIKKYVTNKDATFPSSIIISVDIENTAIDKVNKTMTLFTSDDSDLGADHIGKIARVLDGQHRLAGLEDYTGSNFEVPVSIFVGLDIADQAYIFSTVNLAQTKVNRSLAYDLYDYAKHRSPQKTAHNIAIALNEDPKSPFYERIKRLGVSDGITSEQTITQAAFVESLIRLISKDPMKDRDDALRNRRLIDYNDEKFAFRGDFIQGDDLKIAQIVNDYFQAVKLKYPDAWLDTSKGAVLSKTNAFMGLMRFLPTALRILKIKNLNQDVKGFSTIFDNWTLKSNDFTTERFKPGSSGASEIYRTLNNDILQNSKY